MGPLDAIGGALAVPGRHRRQAIVIDGRAHIELRGLAKGRGETAHRVAAEAKRALSSIQGVDWVAVDNVLSHVVVAFDDDEVDMDDLMEAVEGAEEAAGVAGERFPDHTEHPGINEPIQRHVIALCADGAGLGLALFGQALQSTPLPTEVAAIFSFIDNEPRLRHRLERVLGLPLADLSLALANAVGQGLSHGPLGLLADMAHRGNLLGEATARKQAFLRAEHDRWADPPNGSVGVLVDRRERPTPLPGGPVERYSDRSALAALGAAGITYATTGSPRRTAAILMAAVPKAARLGREAFAAHLDRTLSARDLLVLYPRSLRRLDRVDTVVIDSQLVTTGRQVVSGLEVLDGADLLEVQRHLSALFEPDSSPPPHEEEGWELGPATDEEAQRSELGDALQRLNGSGRGRTVVLRRDGVPVAVVAVDDELSAGATELIRAARRQGSMVVLAGDDLDLVTRSGADLLIAGGDRLAGAIRSLQEDGCVVALVAPGGAAHVDALWAADVGLEVPAVDGSLWAGDIVLNQLSDALFVVEAMVASREVSRQSVALSLCGSGVGAVFALGGRRRTASYRMASAINASALLAIANGIRAAVALNRHPVLLPAQPTRWHELEPDEVLARLGSSLDGLPRAEAVRRRRELGTNGRPPGPSFPRNIAQELANPLTPVLVGGAGASAAIGSAADAALVAAVVVLNAVIGGFQRFNSERAIMALSESSATPVRVRRPDGDDTVVAEDLAPGDVVLLAAGDAVPADCRIVKAEDLEVDESPLTGESELVRKGPDPSFSPYVAERTSMLYEGTTIAAGEATCVVVAVGSDTAAGTLAADNGPVTSAGGVEARLGRLTRVTLPVSLAGGAALLGTGLLRGRPLRQSVGSAVSLAVAAVPEGLPVLATMAQLASARRLSTRGALVRNPRAIEALGRIRVLCLDKTGTVTEGRIQMQMVSDGTEARPLPDLPDRFRRIAAAGRRATPEPTPGVPLPHLTDQAVVAGAAQAGIDVTVGAPGWERLDELPFEPARGYHATLGSTQGARLLSVKGAPESVILRCARWAGPSGEVMVDDQIRGLINEEVERLARQGMRVLAVAEGVVAEGVVAAGVVAGGSAPRRDELTDDVVNGLTLLGLLVLSDPIRATAADAVDGVRRAGVNVVMVTGDHPSTAEGIAFQLGILNSHQVLTGAQMADMNDSQLESVVDDVSVFARVTPADKVRIVAALQHRGQAVAMTGDGANDAPAIRLADVGIALGAKSTPAARRAADLVVTDDRIETIVDAIIEGRAMWRSVRQALAILLGGNLGEVAFTVAGSAVSGRAPLSPRQLLVVNLLTDVTPALAIALRPPTTRTPEALLEEGPEASLGRSLEKAIAVRAVSTAVGAGSAWAVGRVTGGPRRASTIALVALVGAQLAQTMLAGGFDPLVVAAAVGSFVLLAGIVQVPGASQFFDCTPLDPMAWAIAGGGAAIGTGASLVGAALVDRFYPGKAAQPISP